MSTPTTPTATLLRGARPLGGEPRDLLLRDGVIAEVGDPGAPGDARGLADPVPEDVRVVDATGLVALPGLVDLHTHLREPGREDAETVDTGTRAAALGGYTAVHAMANTAPVADTAGVVEQVWRLGRAAGWCDVRPVGAVTVGIAGERLAELGAMADSAAAVRVFSDDGHCVSDAVLMRRALEYVKAFDGVVAQHAQEPRLTEGAQMHEGVVSGALGLRGWPAVAEEAVIARDVLLAGHVGSRLHVCHLSTAGSVEIVRWAKARGIDVTAEVTPHHLLLTDELVRGYDPVYKVNPPLRSDADVHALREGVADGTIDVVATDHAPHPVESKDCEWSAAAMGMTGLETALSVVAQALVEPGHLDWAGVARVMSVVPATIGRVSTQGRPLAAGEPAHLVLVDPSARWTVDPAAMATKGRNSPFAGRELPARVVATFYGGHPTVLDGALASSSTAAAGGWGLMDQVVAGLVLLALVPVLWWLMLRGWRNRERQQSGFPEPAAVADTAWTGGSSPEAAASTVTGTYVSTVLAGRPLERVVAHGLGTRSQVEVASEKDAAGAGRLVFRRSGARSFAVPATALTGVTRARGQAGKVMLGKEDLVVISWRLGDADGAAVQTAVRTKPQQDAPVLVALVQGLMPQQDGAAA